EMVLHLVLGEGEVARDRAVAGRFRARRELVRLVDAQALALALVGQPLPQFRHAPGEDVARPLAVEDLLRCALALLRQEAVRLQLGDVERDDRPAAAPLLRHPVAPRLREEAPQHALQEGAEAALFLAVAREQPALEEVAEEFLREVLRVLDRRPAGRPDELVDGPPVEREEAVPRLLRAGRRRIGFRQHGRPDRVREVLPAAAQRGLEAAHRYDYAPGPPRVFGFSSTTRRVSPTTYRVMTRVLVLLLPCLAASCGSEQTAPAAPERRVPWTSSRVAGSPDPPLP